MWPTWPPRPRRGSPCRGPGRGPPPGRSVRVRPPQRSAARPGLRQHGGCTARRRDARTRWLLCLAEGQQGVAPHCCCCWRRVLGGAALPGGPTSLLAPEHFRCSGRAGLALDLQATAMRSPRVAAPGWGPSLPWGGEAVGSSAGRSSVWRSRLKSATYRLSRPTRHRFRCHAYS